MKRSGFLMVIFFLSWILYVLSVGIGSQWLGFLTKPLLILSLIGYYLSLSSYRSKPFLIALVFCCLGDSFLLFDSRGEIFFILGLVSFLLGHLLFIMAFRQHRGDEPAENTTQRVRLSFPIVLAGTGLVVILLPRLGPLLVPVIVYAAAISAMVIAAIFRLGRTNTISFWLVFSGALLFMASDSILAINKFLVPVNYSTVLIMGTYAAAQYLIVKGILAHTK